MADPVLIWIRLNIVRRHIRATSMRFASDIEANLECRGPIDFSPGKPVPIFEKVRHWSYLAEQYLLASDYLRTRDVPLLQPWFQVTGHAIECSVKAFICAVGKHAPKKHNLIKLLDIAVASGLVADKGDVVHVISINHIYCRDLQSETRYKARFPSDRWEPIAGSIPEQRVLSRIVNEFCTQAAAANELNKQPSA